MDERRKSPRKPAYYGAAVALKNRNQIIGCTVRDVSESGARLEFDSTLMLPSEFDLTIKGRSKPLHARSAWRSRDAIGVSLVDAEIPPEVARRMRRAEQEREALRRRMAEIAGGY